MKKNIHIKLRTPLISLVYIISSFLIILSFSTISYIEGTESVSSNTTVSKQSLINNGTTITTTNNGNGTTTNPNENSPEVTIVNYGTIGIINHPEYEEDEVSSRNKTSTNNSTKVIPSETPQCHCPCS